MRLKTHTNGNKLTMERIFLRDPLGVNLSSAKPCFASYQLRGLLKGRTARSRQKFCSIIQSEFLFIFQIVRRYV